MKSTGIIRKIDELGRIVIPIEIRQTLDIHEKDALEIMVNEEKIILTKQENACIFCGKKSGLIQFKNKYICSQCRKKIKIS